MSNFAAFDKTIYLDNAATTPLDPEVLKKMLPYFRPEFSNPSSLHTSGRNARQAIDQARKETAEIINADPKEIIFTGSGTESDNLAVLGAARANRSHGDHIVISSIEHKAVLESANLLKDEGFSITILPVDNFGKIDPKKLLEVITPKTILVSIIYANNEIGTIEPIKEISEKLTSVKRSGLFPIFHTDACQAAEYLPINVKELGVDMMTLNGSKIYGPKGIGALYVKNGIKLHPTIVGGDQESGLRSGTESVPLIVGFTEALKKAVAIREEESKRLSILRDNFIKRLREEIPDISVNGDLKDRLPNNVNISVPDVEGESILLMLDTYGIEASTGSACSARDLKPSHVLLAIGQNADLAHGSIRFSMGKNTSAKDIDYVLSIFPKIIKQLKSISALTIKDIKKSIKNE